MSGADIYAKANDAFFDDDYDEALELFTQAIKVEPKNAEFILKRCVVYQKLGKYSEAHSDAATALKVLEDNQGSRTLLARAHLQNGITQHHLKRYTEAQQHFEASKELNPNEKTLVTWLRKNADKIPKAEAAPAPAPVETVVPAATPSQARVRHEWFQNENFVTVEVFMKNIKSDTVSLDFFETSLSLTIKMPTGADYSLELDPLAHEILPKESTYKVLSTKLEIKLKKKQAGILWGALESEDDQGGAMSTTGASSTSKQPKDWNKLVRDIDQDQEKAQGEEALNGLFQQIYKNADEDTKRAMMKSFVESNGTCLSTNWKEVGSAPVETKPPEGMVAKKY
ncbi:SGS domain-containing protein [Chlamydoabsidia padenii]|nr:SGS domain-containing protein [Chlamydoabsidia padenii]